MANRGTSIEQYNEEFTRFDQELKLLQKELEDTLQLNDNFQKSIEQKGDELAAKDEYLMSLREKNAAEIEQLQLEEIGVKENSLHEINFHTTELHNLEIRRQRLQEVRNENARLKSSVSYLEDQANKDRLDHALAMHEMNKEMKLLRQQMEQKLRKELAGLELSFQEEAFNALQDKQKKAMLENAKLKDEVALQGVGISNLTARLIKQQIAHEKCQKVLNKYERKSHVLRERLAEATVVKNDLLKQRESLLNEEFELLKRKEELAQQLYLSGTSAPGTVTNAETTTAATDTASNKNTLSAVPLNTPDYEQSIPFQKSPRKHDKVSQRHAQTTVFINDLITRYINAKETYRSFLAKEKIWIQRYDLIKNLLFDLRPLNDSEKNGNFCKKHFPLKELIQDITQLIQQRSIVDPFLATQQQGSKTINSTAGIAVLTSSVSQRLKFDRPLSPLIPSESSSVSNGLLSTSNTSQGSEVLLEIQKIIRDDLDLAEALKQLKGKESSILTAFQDGTGEKTRPESSLNATKDTQSAEAGLGPQNDVDGQSRKEEDKDQNMVAWTVLKIISLWYGAESNIEKIMYPIDEEDEDEDEINFENEHEDDIWQPLHETTQPSVEFFNQPIEQSVGLNNASAFEKHSSLSTNSQLQDPDFYKQAPLEPVVNVAGLDEEEQAKQVQRREETMNEWEERMLQEILQAREDDVNLIISDVKQQQTGVEYYDHPPETSSWLYKVPPRPFKHAVFAAQIREKLMPKVYTLSVKERDEYRRDMLQLADIGPPIAIHEFQSPISQSFDGKDMTAAPLSRSGVNTARSRGSNTFPDTNINSPSFRGKPRLQRKESQLLHYDSERDPLLFNQKKKNLNLPKSPQKLLDADGSSPDHTHHSSYKKEYVSDRTLPRKLLIALSRSSSSGLISTSKPPTPAVPTPLARSKEATKSADPLLQKKKNKKGLSLSTGALIPIK